MYGLRIRIKNEKKAFRQIVPARALTESHEIGVMRVFRDEGQK